MASEQRWHPLLGPGAMPAIVAAFVCFGAVILPAMAVLLCASFNRLAGSQNLANIARRFAFTLVPIGVAMWAAHLLYHLATGWSAPIVAAERIISGVVASPSAFMPAWLTPAQILLLDAGLLLTLFVAWRVARQHANRLRTAIALVTPWAALSCALYGIGVWILFQPMQMRGMWH